MKTKILLGALVFPLVFTACTNDEFEVNNAGQQQGLEGDMIELPEGFALIGTKGENADTRGGLLNNRMSWYPTLKNDAGSDDVITAADLVLEENWDQIGLAWLNTTPGSQVYSNYKFSNYGWLESDADQTEFDPCEDNILDNGVWFNGTNFVKHDGNGNESVVAAFDGLNSDFVFAQTNFDNAGVAANKGVFHTSLGTIFGGEYLVYYPFNENLINYGYLQATSPTEFHNLLGNNGTQDYRTGLANYCFLVGRTSIEGGTQAANFTLGQLSGLIRVDLNNSPYSSTIEDITTVILYANEGAFYTAIDLDASKITTDPSSVFTQGTALYVNPETATTSKLLTSYAYDTTDGLDISSGATLSFGFAALPTTINSYTVVVQDKAGNSYAQRFNTPLTIPAYAAAIVDVDMEAPSANNMYAYNEASFKQALTKARSVSTPVTIHLLGTVELTGVETIPGNVTVAAETDADKLVLTSGESRSVVLAVQDGAVFDCDVDIQGEGCCGLWPAELRMNGDLAADRTITNEGGKIHFGFRSSASNTTKMTSVINGTINNLVDPNDETNIGDIDINAYTTVRLNGTLTNNGTIDIATAGTGHQNDDAALNVFGTLTNNNEVTLQGNLSTGSNGTFTNNDIFTVKVSAQITGKGVTEQADNAQYICEVNSVVRYNDAINNDPMTAAHRTTLVRFIEGSNYKYVLEPNNDNGQIVNVDGDVINFESKIPAGEVLQLQNEVEGAEPVATTIGNLTIVNGGFELEHAALTMANFEINHEEAISRWTRIEQKLNVTGNVNITNFNRTAGATNLEFQQGVTVGGNMTIANTNGDDVIFAEGTLNAITGNLNVNKTNVIFGKSTENNVGGNIDVDADGEMEFQLNSLTAITNWFYNDGKVNIAPATSSSGSDVAARVTCAGFDHQGDENYWTNGSFPIIRR